MRALTPRERRLSALLLLIVIIGLAWAGIIRPVLSKMSDYEEAIITNRDLLERYQRIAAGQLYFEEQLKVLERDSMVHTAYLSGNSEAIVAAQLQSRAKSIVERSGGRFNSVQILPSEMESGFRKITIRVKATADMPALSKILFHIESGHPLLFLKNVDITARSASRRNANAPIEDVQLGIVFDVYGYLRLS